MKQQAVLALLALGMAGCSTLQTSDTRSTEEMLTAAGFQRKAADTPYYLFADPDTCRCLYVGTEEQYQKYLTLRRQQDIADEELLTAADREDALGGIWGLWP